MKNWKQEINNAFAPVLDALDKRGKELEKTIEEQNAMLEQDDEIQDDYMDYIDQEVEAINK